jgi:hypothetical protein
MITADHDLFANDKYGYRAALIDAFRSRGIAPEGVISYSEESLLWYHPEVAGPKALPPCKGLQFDVFSIKNKKSRRAQNENNSRILKEFAMKNAENLGLSTDPELEIKLGSIHEMHRMTDDGKLVFDMVVELTQDREVPLDPSDPASPTFTFRGGTTLIVNQTGWVRYSIKMSIHDKKDDDKNVRLKRQRDYLIMRQSEVGLAPYADVQRAFDRALKADFGLIHRGHY